MYKCQDFYLGEPEGIYNPGLDCNLSQKVVNVAYPRSAQAQINARTSTWVNQKGYTTLPRLTCAIQNNFQKGYTILPRLTCVTQNHFHVAYPRSTQEHINARTSTWVNQKGYTTLPRLTCTIQNNFQKGNHIT